MAGHLDPLGTRAREVTPGHPGVQAKCTPRPRAGSAGIHRHRRARAAVHGAPVPPASPAMSGKAGGMVPTRPAARRSIRRRPRRRPPARLLTITAAIGLFVAGTGLLAITAAIGLLMAGTGLLATPVTTAPSTPTTAASSLITGEALDPRPAPLARPPPTAGQGGVADPVPADPVPADPAPVGPGRTGSGQAVEPIPTAAGRPAAGARYAWPLLPPRVLVRFHAPSQPYGPGHRGVDLGGSVGQPVLAARAGVVAFAGMVAGRGVVSVLHDDGLRTTYEPVRAAVLAGTSVAAGDVLGRLQAGHRGCSTACLHWGLRRDRHEYLDPLVLLRPAQVRLLPLDE